MKKVNPLFFANPKIILNYFSDVRQWLMTFPLLNIFILFFILLVGSLLPTEPGSLFILSVLALFISIQTRFINFNEWFS